MENQINPLSSGSLAQSRCQRSLTPQSTARHHDVYEQDDRNQHDHRCCVRDLLPVAHLRSLDQVESNKVKHA